MNNTPDYPDIPDELPTIRPEETFRFECGPHQPCFNRCCSQLNLPLTPYDCLRLAMNLELDSAEFLRVFTSMGKDEATAMPSFQLRMIESPDAPCPFVTPAGCSVYDDRPGACRAYPLGRGAKIAHDGVAERFFIVREDHCAGFGSGADRTPGQWLADQDLQRHIYFNDRYMRLLSMIRASGKPIGARLEGMALLALWQADNFREFIEKMKIRAQVEWQGNEKALADNSLAGREAALEFGLAWLELLLFGHAPDMRKRQASI